MIRADNVITACVYAIWFMAVGTLFTFMGYSIGRYEIAEVRAEKCGSKP